MFDRSRLAEALATYKKDFVQTQWPEEKYKWEAVQCFQQNWDVNAEDFAQMLTKALSQTANLLASANNFPAGMITGFSRVAPEEVRSMYLELYDESRDVVERIERFKQRSDSLLERHGNGAAQHYQHENAIMTYLWLRYPDKYYIYKFGEVKAASAALASGYSFKKGHYADNIRNFIAFYDEICEELKQDDELRNLLQSQMTASCYPDPELRTLTIDVGFYISRRYRMETELPQVDTRQLEENADARTHAEDCVSTVHYWVYAPGDNAQKWDEFYAQGIMGLNWSELGDLRAYADREAMRLRMKELYQQDSAMTNAALATWQFCHDIHVGDVIFVKKGRSEILGRGIVEANYEFDETRTDYKHIHRMKWTHKGSWQPERQLPLKTLTDCTSSAEAINALFTEPETRSDDEHMGNAEYPSYTMNDFLKEVYMTEAKYNRLAAVLRKKKNIILQGAPGVGKTYAAKRLAYSMMGEKNDDRIELVQFHQSYSYEDFVMGYKPVGDGFALKYGIFYRFCQKAANHPEQDYFFIIDEINRGNLSKIFGELLMLIEADYRDTKVTLAYNGLPFSVPKQLHIIGMMNTADRSLAMIDYALRRRFSFFDMEPGFDSEGFLRYQRELHNETFDALIDRIKELNRDIAQDKSLGKGFCIGHSYFCNVDNATACTEEWMQDVVDFDVLPMLREYWFDDAEKLRRWENILHGVFQ